jgi:putative ABC transport system permease protein
MNFRTLLLRTLCFHWRGHLGVLLGAAVGSAALIGALVVGDSVRLSLRELALQRLGWVDAALAPSDRFFSEDIDGRTMNRGSRDYSQATVALRLPATVARQDGSARANQVNILGVRPDFWRSSASSNLKSIPRGAVVLNEALAAHLGARMGDELVVRLHKPSALSREVPISPQNDASIALRVRVHAIAAPETMGNFNLRASQVPAFNLFLSQAELADAAGLKGRANVFLAGMPGLDQLPPEQLTRECLPGQQLSLKERIGLEWFSITPKRVRKMIQDGPRSEILARGLQGNLDRSNTLSDLDLDLRLLTNLHQVELRSGRIFLEPAVASAIAAPPQNWTGQSTNNSRSKSDPEPFLAIATNARPVLTYLVNQLRAGERAVPYSMVTAADSPWTPPDMQDDEIILSQWLADDLQLKVGDRLDLTYFLVESGASLIERTNRFRVRAAASPDGLHGDRTLMPDFPGLAKAESTHEWDAGFPLVHKIRDQDEDYWKKYRGTPKAFVTLAAGQQMWGNRFGALTAIRFPVPANQDPSKFRETVERGLLSKIDPASLGLRFNPARAQALAGADQSQDFGQLFLGFSFFLIAAALILMALLFQFGIEQRTTEIGTLLALGFTPARVRWLLLGEGIAVAFIGGMIGVAGGVAYAKAMLYGLATLWRDAVGTSTLYFHATPATIVIGLFASVVVCAVTIWFVLRKQARHPARELLAQGGEENVPSARSKVPVASRSGWIALGGGLGAVILIALAMFKGDSSSAGTFFGAGALLLVAELAAVAVLLRALDRSEAGRRLSVSALGLRNCTRRRSRSLASVALLACGSFLVVAVGANRLDAGRDAVKRSSGTGGFALFGESTLPIVRDLNTKAGREFFNLDDDVMKGVSVVPFRVRDGDDASCLNLNRAQTPRLLGVNPDLLAGRRAFSFAKVMKDLNAEQGWQLLRMKSETANSEPETNEVPAIGDATSIQWALGKKIGDTIEFTDEGGQKFNLRLVAGVAASILQGNLLIDEAEFTRRFPSESGHRMFLIDTPSNTRTGVVEISAMLTRALQDVGLELTPTMQRLARFNAVQNTYLNTFQVLGGFGLLLGSAGLGVVVLRNVLERRGELGLFQAVGFRRRTLRWLVLSEHAALLWLGLAVGITAALAAVLPALLSPGARVHYAALAATLAGVLASGLIWTWFATWLALRGRLLDALRNE